MDCSKTGKLLLALRRERKMTQKEIAQKLNISDKTISKWERGFGCPDVSLLPELSEVFGVHIEKILAGELSASTIDGGNMKRIQFYVCPTCGAVFTATGKGELSCCGRKLAPLPAAKADPAHTPKVEAVETDYYLTFHHTMTKQSHLAFVAYVTYDSVLLVKLYPEQDAALRLPKMRRGELYTYCTEHGLMKQPWSAT